MMDVYFVIFEKTLLIIIIRIINNYITNHILKDDGLEWPKVKGEKGAPVLRSQA